MGHLHELRKLYSALYQRRNNWTLRARQSMLWNTDDGDLFFNASLGGRANAFMNWRDGQWRVISGRASMALDFRTHTGWAMVRANFRFLDNPVNYVGLFRGAGRVDYMLVSTKETVPEINGTFTVDADFGIAGDGTAHYSLTSGSMRVFYRHDFNGRKKLVAVGDEMLGSRVRSFIGGSANYPSVWFDEDGTALVAVTLEDNEVANRFPSGCRLKG